jgi:hypothetical protein
MIDMPSQWTSMRHPQSDAASVDSKIKHVTSSLRAVTMPREIGAIRRKEGMPHIRLTHSLA